VLGFLNYEFNLLHDHQNRLVNDIYLTGESIMLYLGETIPKLKGRQHSGSSAQSGQQQQQNTAKNQKKKGRKGK